MFHYIYMLITVRTEYHSLLLFHPEGVSKFLGTLSNSLRENISHVATAAGVTSDGPEPVFDRMQVLVHTNILYMYSSELPSRRACTELLAMYYSV